MRLEQDTLSGNDGRPEPPGSNAAWHHTDARVPNRQNGQTRLETKTTNATIKVASLNICGGGAIGTRMKWQHINQIMREKRVALLAVQETHLTEETITDLHSQFPGRIHIKHTSDLLHPNSKGVAIILNKQLTKWKEATTREIFPGRALLLTIPWRNNSVINVLAIYAPNPTNENQLFWETLDQKWLDENLPLPDVMLGDFNLVEEPIDRLPVHGDAPSAIQSLNKFKERLNLFDGWR